MKKIETLQMEAVEGGWPDVFDALAGGYCGGTIVAISFGIAPLAVIMGAACIATTYGVYNGNL